MKTEPGTCGEYIPCPECDRDGDTRCGLPYEHEGAHLPANDVKIIALQSALAQAVSEREAAERETVRRIVDFAQGWARKAGVDGYALGAREHAVMRELLVAVLRGDWRKP